jgi:DnaJ-class molecular chaperone
MPGGISYARRRKVIQRNLGLVEQRCPACNGTGFPQVRQPDKLGHRIFPAACVDCEGKGRIPVAGEAGLGSS